MDASRGTFADVLPGPELAVALASVDRSVLDGDGQADLLLARSHLLAWVQAELLDDVYMVARDVLTDPASRAQDGGHDDTLDYVSAQIVGWALHWSRSYAYGEVSLARSLTERLPAVRDALRSGRIDEAKAAAIAHALAMVDDDELARRIAGKVLRNAPRWILSQLRESLRYHVDRADPANARRRYTKRVAGRNVYLTAQPDGTANLSGVDLPPHKAAQAYDRLDRIARTARAAGDVRNLGQLRADAMTDILAGVPFQLTPTVDPASADADAEQQAGQSPERGHGPVWRLPDDPRCPAAGRDRDDPWPRGLTPLSEDDQIDEWEYDRLCLTDEDLAWVDLDHQPWGATGDEQDDPPWWTTATPAPAHTGQPRESRFRTGNSADPDPVLSPAVLAGDRCVCGGVLPDPHPGTLDVQVKLTTLIGLDEHPALIPGFGPTLAPIARQAAFNPIAKPVWAWSVFDETGDLLHHGTTTHRPPRPAPQSRFGTRITEPTCTCPRVEPSPRRATIDLHLTPRTLAELLANPPAGYERLIADIAAQAAKDAATNPPGKWTEVDDHGTLLAHGHTGRMPDATEDAFIRARDRSCRTPGCRVPASRTEIDHRTAHAEGGPSHRGGCHCLCKPHHLGFKHRKGFTVTKVGTTTIWTVPNGLTFEVPIDQDIILTDEDA